MADFGRIVARYSGVSVPPTIEHFRIMAYARLTWRESLGDVEATLGANATKLHTMGLRQAVRRAALAYANERCDYICVCVPMPGVPLDAALQAKRERLGVPP